MEKTKRMPQILALVFAAFLALGMTACGGGGDDGGSDPVDPKPGVEEPDNAGGDEGEPSDAGDDAGAALAVGEWTSDAGAFSLSIVGAELFTDVNGGDALRVYYDFSSDEANVFSVAMVDELDAPYYAQNGDYLENAFTAENVAEWGNDGMCIRPGTAIRCIEEYSVSLDAGEVEVCQYARGSDSPVVAYTFDLANLPGKPEADLAAEPVLEPLWLDSWPWEGAYHDEFYVSIDDAKVVPGRYGEDVLRVYFTFTNNSSEATSMEWEMYMNRAFQDGVQLWTGVPETAVDEDGNYMIDVEPGASVSAAYCYELRSDSPVEVELMDPWADDVDADGADTGIGGAFSIA